MSANTSIEWTDKTWNPVRGCSRVSPGCDNCYAMGQAHRYSGVSKKTGKALPFHGLTTKRNGKVDWTGVARFIPEALEEPLHWREPQRIFVNSMSDLFHHSVTNEEIAAVFGVMAACPQHTFQVLTKRPERMREWFVWLEDQSDSGELDEVGTTLMYAADYLKGSLWSSRVAELEHPSWPLTNVWLGVSAEDQQRADERIPELLSTPAAVRFVSAEPLLGPIDLTRIVNAGEMFAPFNALGRWNLSVFAGSSNTGIDWVIGGGESGPGARAFHIDWARSLRNQCREAGVAFFLKQVGANLRERNDVGFDRANDPDCAWDLSRRLFDGGVIEDYPDGVRNDYQGAPVRIRLIDRKGGDMSEWPEDLRVREFPEVGK